MCSCVSACGYVYVNAGAHSGQMSSGVTATRSCEPPDVGTGNSPPEEQQGLLTIG